MSLRQRSPSAVGCDRWPVAVSSCNSWSETRPSRGTIDKMMSTGPAFADASQSCCLPAACATLPNTNCVTCNGSRAGGSVVMITACKAFAGISLGSVKPRIPRRKRISRILADHHRMIGARGFVIDRPTQWTGRLHEAALRRSNGRPQEACRGETLVNAKSRSPLAAKKELARYSRLSVGTFVRRLG